MAPPGGASHFNIFSATEPEAMKPVNKCQASRNKSSVFTGPEQHNPSRDERTAVAPEAQATGHTPDLAEHPSTKVLAPPGGKTNIAIFGESSEQAKPTGKISP